MPGNIPNCGKLPEKFPSLGSGQIYYSGWWRERSQGDFTNPTTQVPPPKKIQQSSQVENTRKHFLAKHLPFIKKTFGHIFAKSNKYYFFRLVTSLRLSSLLEYCAASALLLQNPTPPWSPPPSSPPPSTSPALPRPPPSPASF